MVKRKLNIDVEKSVSEFESIARRLGLNMNKKEAESAKKRENKLPPNKKFEKKSKLTKGELLFKLWKRIFLIFLIFSIFMFIIIIFTISSYYKTEIQEKEMQELNKRYISGSIHLTSKLNASFFNLVNFTGFPEENVQNFIIIKDKECTPNILCKYIGYTREYDLSTIVDEDFLLDKKVINCYDSSNCMANFTYLESSKELFSKQIVRIEKDGKDTLSIYDEKNNLIAKIEKRKVGDIQELFIWFNFD